MQKQFLIALFLTATMLYPTIGKSQTLFWRGDGWLVAVQGSDQSQSCVLETSDTFENGEVLRSFVEVTDGNAIYLHFHNSEWNFANQNLNNLWVGFLNLEGDEAQIIKLDEGRIGGTSWNVTDPQTISVAVPGVFLDVFVNQKLLILFRDHGSSKDISTLGIASLEGGAEGVANLQRCSAALSADD